ncbi:MAG: sigma-70 family RNA polymerase sigma factor [Labilithrix sp.]|nr:sigma-70 family RNA polymerase sigma factor [Labilithrix sp.]
MDERLVAIVARARAAWPKVAVAEDAFAAHLEERAASFLDKVHGDDLYLACGVLHRDRAALASFEERFMARVPEYVLRIRAGGDVVDEVKQLLRERLIMGGKIADYTGKGALGGWLRVAAVRTTLNHLRAKSPESAELGEEISVAGDPELSYVKEHARDLFADAFKRVLDALDPNERTILRLHYIDGLTMDQLAHLYKTPRSTIARRVAEARQQVLASTEELLREERRLSPSAVASVIRQARSQVQITITRLFR